MSDPVIGGSFTEPVIDQALHAAAIEAIVRVTARRWPGATEKLRRAAEGLLAHALEIGPGGAVVLVPGSHPDVYRLADAVRRTETNQCAACGGPRYAGRPSDGDLRAADQVIMNLVQG